MPVQLGATCAEIRESMTERNKDNEKQKLSFVYIIAIDKTVNGTHLEKKILAWFTSKNSNLPKFFT